MTELTTLLKSEILPWPTPTPKNALLTKQLTPTFAWEPLQLSTSL